MLKFARNIHNRRPLLWAVIAFIVLVAMSMTMSIWWNYLLVQNDRVLRQMTAAASQPESKDIPLALLMVLGILCSVVLLLGLVYMFLRLIRAVQLNLAQSQFIAAVTHELRSPVASLQLMLQTIRDPSTPLEKRIEFERCMEIDLTRLRGLVDQVLDTARLENLLTAPSRERVQVGVLLGECVALFDARIKTTGGALQLEPIHQELLALVNPQLLTTAVTNVLDNAIKYSHGPAEIAIRAHETPKSVVLEIEDKGVGLDRREQKRIFRRFYRGKDPITQSRPGTGLGLYFARLALATQGGTISAFSRGAGLGATFRIEIEKVFQ